MNGQVRYSRRGKSLSASSPTRSIDFARYTNALGSLCSCGWILGDSYGEGELLKFGSVDRLPLEATVFERHLEAAKSELTRGSIWRPRTWRFHLSRNHPAAIHPVTLPLLVCVVSQQIPTDRITVADGKYGTVKIARIRNKTWTLKVAVVTLEAIDDYTGKTQHIHHEWSVISRRPTDHTARTRVKHPWPSVAHTLTT